MIKVTINFEFFKLTDSGVLLLGDALRASIDSRIKVDLCKTPGYQPHAVLLYDAPTDVLNKAVQLIKQAQAIGSVLAGLKK